MTAAKLRAGVFSRESKGKDSSIEDQTRENLAACVELNAEVVVTLRDVVGASRFSTKERVGWPGVISLVESGQIDVLVVWEVARADRVMDSWVPFITTCQKNAVRLHITSQEVTYDPRKAEHRKALLNMGSDAEAETGKLSERARKGIRGAVLAGKAHGYSAYGYTREYDPADRQKFTERPNDCAKVAAEIITRIAREDPIKQIVQDLNDAGIPASYGGKWTRVSVKRLATNYAYIGMRNHKGALHDGNWPAIVSKSVFYRAQEVLGVGDSKQAESRKKSAPGALKYLLSYLATCAVCREPLNSQATRVNCKACGKAFSSLVEPCPKCGCEERQVIRVARYRCSGKACVSIDVEYLDKFISVLSVGRLAMMDARAAYAADDETIAEAKARVKALEKDLRNLEESAALGVDNGGVSLEFAMRVEPAKRAELIRAKEEVAKLTPDAALLSVLDSDNKEKSWHDLSLAAQRRIIRDNLFEKIEVGKSVRRLSRWATEEERLDEAGERTATKWKETE